MPDGGGFAIAAGLEQLIEYIEDLHFDEEDIAYLRGKGIFCEEFLEYLRTFRFTGDIYAVPEGTPVFPQEPMVTVRAPAIEAQLVETFALLTVNHQSLIATKANRIVRAAKGRARAGVRLPPRAGRRRPPSSAPAPPTSAAATARPAPSRTELYGVPARRHHGPRLGADVRQPSTTPSRPTASFIPTTPSLLVDTYNTLRSGMPERHPRL